MHRLDTRRIRSQGHYEPLAILRLSAEMRAATESTQLSPRSFSDRDKETHRFFRITKVESKVYGASHAAFGAGSVTPDENVPLRSRNEPKFSLGIALGTLAKNASE